MRSRLKLYPDLAAARTRRAVADVLVAAWTAAAAVAGFAAYEAVLRLQAVGSAISDIGGRLNHWIDAIGGAVPGQNLPVLGGALGDYVKQVVASLQGASGDAVIQQGRAVSDDVRMLAVALGVIAGLLVVHVVTPWYVIRRWRGARELAAMVTFLESADAGRARALLAHRAAFTLPVRRVMAVTSDPVEDLREGRYDVLAAELLISSGLEPRRLGKDDR